jgi:hypothetical protein
VFNLYSLTFCFWDRIPFPEARHPRDRKLRPFVRPPVLPFLALPTESIHHHNPLTESTEELATRQATSTRPQGLVITSAKEVDPRVVGQHFSHRIVVAWCYAALLPACLPACLLVHPACNATTLNYKDKTYLHGRTVVDWTGTSLAFTKSRSWSRSLICTRYRIGLKVRISEAQAIWLIGVEHEQAHTHTTALSRFVLVGLLMANYRERHAPYNQVEYKES